MPKYQNPETKLFRGLSRCYVASKAGGIVLPHVIDIHPVSGKCNLDCRWCVGRFGRKKINPLSQLLKKENIVDVLQKILDPGWPSLWPSEFHFCGCDSEPLLSNATLPAICFLLEKTRIVELITNGLLLGKSKEMLTTVARIHKLSISLDVTNDHDYRVFKFPNPDPAKNGYTKVLENIKKINKHRKQQNTTLHIAVTFVATPKTYNKREWQHCFKELKKIGVREIRVRDDLNGTFGVPIKELKTDIENIDNESPHIKIRYISPEKSYDDFPYCRGPRLWPALGENGCLYPCAHTATSKWRPFGNLLDANSILELYKELFHAPNPYFIPVNEIGCNRNCPSVLGRYNDPSLAQGQLGAAFYV